MHRFPFPRACQCNDSVTGPRVPPVVRDYVLHTAPHPLSALQTRPSSLHTSAVRFPSVVRPPSSTDGQGRPRRACGADGLARSSLVIGLVSLSVASRRLRPGRVGSAGNRVGRRTANYYRLTRRRQKTVQLLLLLLPGQRMSALRWVSCCCSCCCSDVAVHRQASTPSFAVSIPTPVLLVKCSFRQYYCALILLMEQKRTFMLLFFYREQTRFADYFYV